VSRRPPASAPVPAPDRASEAVIARCRAEIESGLKQRLRRLLLPFVRRRHKLAEVGEGFQWPRKGDMGLAPGSRIGRYAYLGAGFEAHGQVVVGDLCMISAGMKIVGADHLYDEVGNPSRLAFPDVPRPITVFEADVFTGQRVTVIEGLRIGRGAVIGSGAVVTKDVAPYTVVAGVPAREIRRRFTAEDEARHRAIVEPVAVSS